MKIEKKKFGNFPEILQSFLSESFQKFPETLQTLRTLGITSKIQNFDFAAKPYNPPSWHFAQTRVVPRAKDFCKKILR